jgi:GntR family transcriptional regulator
MISIDRASSTPVHDQLVEQLRYLIASGHYKIDETLPSTRTLGEQLGLSFHTVRKAYQRLEQEGLLASRVGSGFRVKERVQLRKEERMERGAAIAQEALQRMIGLGLQESEMEYLFQEQFALLEGGPERHKLVFAAPFREMAELCAEQLAAALQQPVEPVVLEHLERHRDADYLLARYADLRQAMTLVPRADALGVVTHLNPEALEQIVRLLPHQTLGIVTRFADAIPPLMSELRALTGFAGQMLAASIDDGTQHLGRFIDQTDLVVYTPQSRRRLQPLLAGDRRHTALTVIVSPASVEALRQAVPS